MTDLLAPSPLPPDPAPPKVAPDPLGAWRAARAALDVARASVDEETVRVAREGREVYLRHVSPARRERLLPVPDDLLSGRVGPHVLEAQWADLLTPAQQAAARPELDVLAASLRAAWAALPAAERAVREAAARVPDAVGADASPEEGGAWRLVRTCWPGTYASQGGGAASYARARASVAARELQALGYRVRCAVREYPAGAERRAALRAFEVWVWATEEGAAVAPHQQALGYDGALRAAAAEGVSPTALYGGNAAPIEDAIRAGADRSARMAPPLTWEHIAEGEDLP